MCTKCISVATITESEFDDSFEQADVRMTRRALVFIAVLIGYILFYKDRTAGIILALGYGPLLIIAAVDYYNERRRKMLRCNKNNDPTFHIKPRSVN